MSIDDTIRVKREAFLKAFAICGNISMAAKAAKCHRQAHYGWMKDDKEYPARFKDAQDTAVDRMEAEADRRALRGVEEPVFYEGQQCGYKMRYSDNLLMFRLKALRPDQYRDRQSVEHSGPDGQPVQLEVKPEALTDEHLAHIALRGGLGVAAKKNGSSGANGVH